MRYCGGCNSRYDRVALVKRLEGLLPELSFAPARSGVPYAAVVVACGCASRCANISDLVVPAGKLIYLSGWDDLLSAKKQLESIGQLADPEQARSLTHKEVLSILPHRAPMLFIDTVSRLIPGDSVTAHFYIPPGLPVFEGHFPGSPTFPGVLIVESAAQAAGLLMMTVERYAGKTPLLVGIKRVNFRRRILPEDTMDIHVSLTDERKGLGLVTCQGQIFAENTLAADVELRLAFR